MRTADLLVLGASEIVTVDGGRTGPKRGAQAMNRLGVIRDGALAIRHGKIVGIGHANEITQEFRGLSRVFCRGRSILPGFVDCHTHPVFARMREDEFAQRCRGADYEEILAAGGGIHASAEALGEASLEDLVAGVAGRLDDMLRHGVVALEGKSGYGLSTESEIKSLEALRRAGRDHPVHVVRTFLGAHVVPLAYRGRRKAYVREVIEEMLPRVARRKLATFCDVFVEKGAFGLSEARRILTAAKRHGLRPKLHIDQFRPGGGARLAAEVRAISVEHVDATGPAGIRALARARVIPVLLPSASLFTGLTAQPNARALIEAGCAVALSTDFNPGTSPTTNLSFVASLGCTLLGMTPEEVVTAITRNAAAAIGLEHRHGRLAVGRRANFVVLDAPSYEHLPYRQGENLVRDVFVGGRPVVRNRRRVGVRST